MGFGEVEKRLFSRVECLVDLEFLVKGSEDEVFHSVEATDLSLSGLGVRFDPERVKLESGTMLLVRLYGLQPLQAVVRWVNAGKAGLRFSETLEQITESWVGEVLGAQGSLMCDLLPRPLLDFSANELSIDASLKAS